MKTVAILALCTGLVVLAVAGSASSNGVAASEPGYRGPLASLPGIGTVSWRSRCTAAGSRFALGVRLFEGAQSAGVRFRVGTSTVDRNFDVPGGGTSWFRPSGARVQRLAAVAGGESGYTLGALQANFDSGGCGFYDPPRVTVQVYPRRPQGEVPPRGPGGILRPWPIR